MRTEWLIIVMLGGIRGLLWNISQKLDELVKLFRGRNSN